MDEIISSVSRLHQKVRPGRSFERKSMKPETKWRGSNTKVKKKKTKKKKVKTKAKTKEKTSVKA